MAQLSKPYKIALGAMVVLVLAWFTVLKPGDPAEALPAAPATQSAPGAAGLGRAVEKANGAVATSNASAAATQTAVAAASGATGAGAVAAPGPGRAPVAGARKPVTKAASAAPAPDPSLAFLRALKGGRVGVILFHSDEASDDRAVRRALLRADRHGGRVVVRAVPISRVAQYKAITETVKISQAPTVVVIGADSQAHTLVGFTDTKSIDQLVSDVGGPAFAARRLTGYRGRVAKVCVALKRELLATGDAEPESVVRFTRSRRAFADAASTLQQITPSRRYVSFHRLLEQNVAYGVRGHTAGLDAARAGRDGTAAYAAATAKWSALTARVRVAARRVGLAGPCS